MLPKYYLTNKAIEDLNSIWIFSKITWSESKADKYYLHLINDCKRLALNQHLGKKYDEIEIGIYGFSSMKQIIFYKIISDLEIEIIRILHSRMDIKNKIVS